MIESRRSARYLDSTTGTSFEGSTLPEQQRLPAREQDCPRAFLYCGGTEKDHVTVSVPLPPQMGVTVSPS